MVTPGQMQMFNKPEPYECQILGPKFAKQYDYVPSSNLPNAGTYHIRLHDHTLGNALRMELLKDKKVLFAGYRNPHPLEHLIELRIQTVLSEEPKDALMRAVKNLQKTASTILTEFDRQMERKFPEHSKEEDKHAFPKPDAAAGDAWKEQIRGGVGGAAAGNYMGDASSQGLGGVQGSSGGAPAGSQLSRSQNLRDAMPDMM